MLTRNEIELEYRIEHGVILNAGKFEMQPLWTPYFYDIAMNGFNNGSTYLHETLHDMFSVDDEDRKQFPELKDSECVVITYSDDGFVYGTTMSYTAWREKVSECGGS
jgi:hypothetical protein